MLRAAGFAGGDPGASQAGNERGTPGRVASGIAPALPSVLPTADVWTEGGGSAFPAPKVATSESVKQLGSYRCVTFQGHMI